MHEIPDPKFSYVLNYFRSVYNLPRQIEIGYGTNDHKINIHASHTRYFDSFEPFPQETVIRKEWAAKKIPFLFAENDSAPVLDVKDNHAFIQYDILAAAFFFLSGWQEYVYSQKHIAWRFPYEESLQNKSGITHLPVVNYYFDILKTAIEKVYRINLSVSAWSENRFALCLTHDIDNCTTGWQQDMFNEFKKSRFLSALKIFARRLQGRDTWFNFQDILTIEKQYSANSSFYFIPRKGKVYLRPNPVIVSAGTDRERDYASELIKTSPFARLRGYTSVLENGDYPLSNPEILTAMEVIRNAGSEVGVHGSLGSHCNPEQMREDIQRFPFPLTGGRFHYLSFDITRTFDILEALQLQYDSTSGFAEAPGFRNGIAYPFPPYNIRENRPYRLLEIPLTVMDTTFRVYTKTPLNKILTKVISILEEVERFNGCLTVLWHNSYFTPYKFAGWKEIYEAILLEGKKRKALLLSGGQVYQNWKGVLEEWWKK